MERYAVGLSTFGKMLKSQLNMRIDMYVKHMRTKTSDGMTGCNVKTEKEWVEDYLEWSKNITHTQQEVLRYLTREVEHESKDRVCKQ